MPIPDEALMLQIQQGAIESFNTLVKRWEKSLLNHCYRIVNDLSLAEDLRQEIFLRVYRAAGTYRPTAKFSTWVYRIATNLCLDTLAKQRCRKEIPIDACLQPQSVQFHQEFVDTACGPAEVATKKEMEDQVRTAIAHLPDDQRVVVVMRHYDGLKFHEIAEVVGCPVSTVKSRMTTGMLRLSQMLTKRGGDSVDV